MAKILFFNVPAYGHVNPTLPVVTELVRRGHQLVYYNSETFRAAIQATGAAFHPYPDSERFEADFAGRINNLVSVSVFLLEESIRLLPFLLDQIAHQKPDLILFDSIALWGMLSARLSKIPSAASYSLFIQDGVPGLIHWRDYLHLFRQGLTRLPALRRLRGLLVKTYGPRIFPGKSILPCKGTFNIVYTSREFQPHTPAIDDTYHFVGPSILPSSRKETPFPWEGLDPRRAKIYLSLGTLYNTNTEFYRAVLAAFSDHPAQVILSVGQRTSLQDLGPVPENFIILPSVPQLDLLQKVDLFITHGGMNSVSEGLSFGVPLVVVPQQIEQAFNGRQVARLGAGLVLADRPPYGQTQGGALRAAVERVLSDPAYRQNAARLRGSFQRAGGYQVAADIISARLKSPAALPVD